MFTVEIITKKGFKNSRGEHALTDIFGMGIKSVVKVMYSPIYVIDGDISINQMKNIASGLLTDKIIESYLISSRIKRLSSENLSKLNLSISKPSLKFCEDVSVIEVYFKRGVTDVVAESVLKAVRDLGVMNEIEVKTGHKYCLYGKISQEDLDSIATKLLANTLIQEYTVQPMYRQ